MPDWLVAEDTPAKDDRLGLPGELSLASRGDGLLSAFVDVGAVVLFAGVRVGLLADG